MFDRLLRKLRGVSGLDVDPTGLGDLLETTPTLIGISIDEHVVYANRASMQLLGVTKPEQMIGQWMFDFVHPDDRTDARATVERVRATRQAAPFFDVKLISMDGTVLEAEVWVAPVRYAGRDAILVHGFDESARRRTEAELRASEASYRRIAENSSDIISEYTATGQLLYVSPSIERVLGYSPETWTHRVANAVRAITHPDDLPHVESILFGGEMPPSFELLQRIRHRDGEYRWLHTNARRFEGSDGERRVVMVTRDVTDQQRALEALRESEQRFQSLARAVPVGIFRIDNKGRHVYLNERWAELTGIPVEEALANPGRRPLHPDDDGKILELSRRALAEG
jgi:PAS domain S-box-containing protein